MITKTLKFPLMNEAGADGADAGGGAAGNPPADGAAGSVLSGAGGSSAADSLDWMPEKYRVFDGEGDDAKFNVDASSRKMAEAYSALEKKLGSGDLPPESPDGYKLDAEKFGEGFNAEEFMADEKNIGFLKGAHARGMTNAQVQYVVEHALNEFAPDLIAGNVELNKEQCMSSLKESWTDESALNENMGFAGRFFRGLPEELRSVVDSKYGNDPDFIRVAALFGKEMAEDTSANPDRVSNDSAVDVEELMKSEAYRNSRHPDHEKVSLRVRAYFESLYGKEEVA